MRRCRWFVSVLVLTLAVAAYGQSSAPVVTMRVPQGGIQPQVAVDEKGVVHMIYFKGNDAHGDTFYVRSANGGVTWSAPIRVNSQPESVLAVGTIRGAHIAVGKNGRVHVSWMGSQQARPKPPAGKGTPMLYARMNDAGTGFEEQRNIIQEKIGLDGGGSVAADAQGNVYVAWHAPRKEKGDEDDRRVWFARSSDEGKTFEKERAPWDQPTGVCGCCGMRIFADPRGRVYCMYRSASEMVHRDNYVLTSDDQTATFKGFKISEWEVGKCIMSTCSFAAGPQGVLTAWETKEQVFFAILRDGETARPIAAPGTGNNRKHPVIAANAAGRIILAWTEETAWQRGGSVAYQVFDPQGRPIAGQAGKVRGLPAWGLAATFVRKDGTFVVVY